MHIEYEETQSPEVSAAVRAPTLQPLHPTVTTPGRAKAGTAPAGSRAVRMIPALCQGLRPPNPQRHSRSRSPSAAGAKEHLQSLHRTAVSCSSLGPGMVCKGVPRKPPLHLSSLKPKGGKHRVPHPQVAKDPGAAACHIYIFVFSQSKT